MRSLLLWSVEEAQHTTADFQHLLIHFSHGKDLEIEVAELVEGTTIICLPVSSNRFSIISICITNELGIYIYM